MRENRACKPSNCKSSDLRIIIHITWEKNRSRESTKLIIWSRKICKRLSNQLKWHRHCLKWDVIPCKCTPSYASEKYRDWKIKSSKKSSNKREYKTSSEMYPYDRHCKITSSKKSANKREYKNVKWEVSLWQGLTNHIK